MTIELNHTIVAAHDKEASAAFLADLLGLAVGPQYGPFVPVQIPNGVTLDYLDTGDGPITSQHYAFLVSEDEFTEIFGRIQAAGVEYYADPGHRRVGEINHLDGGRGAYFIDPNGHNMEILTRPYGSGS
ncbi:VOC family protein [Streptomyces sp. LHD-70]|uniref:VOC family protein n=1 Tax=Streptomyces sp. LHD-70 TaxID=3072140 RepID=UPI00280E35E2|nr:VOC family protein [Streptomyces sp. LHD-70]MDQ8704129.1 VOC family protein [Streptomyces sp. LHD-70]